MRSPWLGFEPRKHEWLSITRTTALPMYMCKIKKRCCIKCSLSGYRRTLTVTVVGI